MEGNTDTLLLLILTRGTFFTSPPPKGRQTFDSDTLPTYFSGYRNTFLTNYYYHRHLSVGQHIRTSTTKKMTTGHFTPAKHYRHFRNKYKQKLQKRLRYLKVRFNENVRQTNLQKSALILRCPTTKSSEGNSFQAFNIPLSSIQLQIFFNEQEY